MELAECPSEGGHRVARQGGDRNPSPQGFWVELWGGDLGGWDLAFHFNFSHSRSSPRGTSGDCSLREKEKVI